MVFVRIEHPPAVERRRLYTLFPDQGFLLGIRTGPHQFFITQFFLCHAETTLRLIIFRRSSFPPSPIPKGTHFLPSFNRCCMPWRSCTSSKLFGLMNIFSPSNNPNTPVCPVRVVFPVYTCGFFWIVIDRFFICGDKTFVIA